MCDQQQRQTEFFTPAHHNVMLPSIWSSPNFIAAIKVLVQSKFLQQRVKFNLVFLSSTTYINNLNFYDSHEPTTLIIQRLRQSNVEAIYSYYTVWILQVKIVWVLSKFWCLEQWPSWWWNRVLSTVNSLRFEAVHRPGDWTNSLEFKQWCRSSSRLRLVLFETYTTHV